MIQRYTKIINEKNEEIENLKNELSLYKNGSK